MNFVSQFEKLQITLVSCTNSGFLRFHVLHLNYEKFKLYLQNTLNMPKMIRCIFRGVTRYASGLCIRFSSKLG